MQEGHSTTKSPDRAAPQQRRRMAGHLKDAFHGVKVDFVCLLILFFGVLGTKAWASCLPGQAGTTHSLSPPYGDSANMSTVTLPQLCAWGRPQKCSFRTEWATSEGQRAGSARKALCV